MALAHLLYFAISSIPDLKRLTLASMNVCGSEPDFLAHHFLAEGDESESSTLADIPDGLPYIG